MSLDLYFSRGIMKGLGTVFMLRVPQEAGEGSSPRKLLGSYVDEIDYGLFKSKEAPSLNHAWQAEYFLSKAAAVPDLLGMTLTDTVALANFTQTYSVETKAGLNAKASFPGASIGGGIELDYSQLRTATITLGEGSQKLYIPRGFIEAAYEHFAAHSDQYYRVMFDPHRMLIDQIVIARHLRIEVESKSVFGLDFEAKAAAINDLGGGVTFNRTGDRKYSIAIDDGKEYLFAVGAVQADKAAKGKL
jgi:hypothetical protein